MEKNYKGQLTIEFRDSHYNKKNKETFQEFVRDGEERMSKKDFTLDLTIGLLLPNKYYLLENESIDLYIEIDKWDGINCWVDYRDRRSIENYCKTYDISISDVRDYITKLAREYFEMSNIEVSDF